MKKFAILSGISILLNFSIANSKITIHPATDPYCTQNLPQDLRVVSGPVVNLEANGVVTASIDLNQNYSVLVNALEKWMIEMDIAKDPVISYGKKALCFGFNDDVRGANAVAYKDEAVLFGVRLLSELPTMSEATFQDATKFILAHEFAHNLQYRHGLKFNYVLPLLSVKRKELQADCIAGYILRANNEVLFDSQEKLKTLIHAIGDPHSVGDHGMASDRELAFITGRNLAAEDILRGVKVFQVTSAHIINACSGSYPPSK